MTVQFCGDRTWYGVVNSGEELVCGVTFDSTEVSADVGGDERADSNLAGTCGAIPR